MVYSNYTLASVREKFKLETFRSVDSFSQIEPVVPSAELTKLLPRKVALAAAIGTEKARSELIVADVLFELYEHFNDRISLFSGVEFNVDVEQDLTGICDFIVSLSPEQFYIEAPIIVLVEVNKEDPMQGFGQCVAEMLAAQRFNAEKGNDISRIYGAATTGTEWQFLKLEGQQLHVDRIPYSIRECDKILGILASMVDQQV